MDFAAVVLAGGAGKRLGGPAKPTLAVRGTPMLARVLAAVAAARPRIVVGPDALAPILPAGVLLTREEPPGGGPVAATAAGIGLLPGGIEYVALLAADLPFLTEGAVTALGTAASTMDGAVFVDGAGRRQLLCGVWRVEALRVRFVALGAPAGLPVGRLVSGLRVAEVAWTDEGTPPWYDIDTEYDMRQAEGRT
ncbi:MAG TPA: NTP transferase domain-containing protein [Micromonosporaceae bacterium]|nr:NTP transferase domain-containing protein [Micromonosporaceae bacterium]